MCTPKGGRAADREEVDAGVIAEGIRQAGEAVGLSEVASFHAFSVPFEGDARESGATDVERGVDASGLQFLQKPRKGPGGLLDLGCTERLVDQGPNLLFLRGSARALRQGAFLTPWTRRVQALPPMDSPPSRGVGRGCEAERLLKDSERPLDLPEVAEVFPGQAAIGPHPGGDDVDVLVGPVMVLHYGVAVPSHLSGHVGSHPQPGFRLEVFPWEQGDREMADGFDGTRPKRGDRLELLGEHPGGGPREGSPQEFGTRRTVLPVSEEVPKEGRKVSPLAQLANHGEAPSGPKQGGCAGPGVPPRCPSPRGRDHG